MNATVYFLAAASSQYELVYVWNQATPEAKIIIFTLLIFSVMAWSVMGSKAVQMRRAEKVNQLFYTAVLPQRNVLAIFDPRFPGGGCPLFSGGLEGGLELLTRF